MKIFEKTTKNSLLLLYDVVFACFAFVFTKVFLNVRIHSWIDAFKTPTKFDKQDLAYLLSSVLVYLCVILIFNCHQIMWRFAGTKNYIKLFAAVVTGFFVSTIISILFFTGERFAILFNMFLFIWIMGSRMAVRGAYKIIKIRKNRSQSKKEVNVLIVGAGSGGNILLHDLTTSGLSEIAYNVVGFIDGNEEKIGSYIEDVRVLGDVESIPKVCKNYDVEEIYIAIPSLTAKKKAEILNICNSTNCKLKIMESIEKSLQENGEEVKTRNVEIEDLLERDPIVLDNSAIETDIKDKVVLVTGGGGSIGSEICRQIVKYGPKKLIILDIYENNIYDIQIELKEKYPALDLRVVVASVRDKVRLEEVFRHYKPEVVFHAAAHKHVPLMEYSPAEAVKNNVFGTYNVAKTADKFGVTKFVMISTDKAVNPTNVMGATKRMCEMIIQGMAKISKTKFVAVRFGNVLGSNGSVIPLFKRQIAQGGPVTVTHQDITRFFMTIPEASQLVIQAAANAKGGEIFVLDMGKPVRIYDLAENLIRLSGFTPNVDIPIKVTGLRPGEKLYEELLMAEEGLTDTSHKKIFIGKPSDITMEEVEGKLAILKESLEANDNDKIKEAVAKVVPTYKRTDN